MFDSQNLYLFFIASLLLNLTPGNDMLYVASRSISQGIKAGLFSALGIFIGCFVHISAAVFGLSFIIAQSAFAFNLVKFLGAGYLLYLGIKAIVAKTTINTEIEKLARVEEWKLLKQGIIINVLNPKVAVFFLSFLPQFVDPSSPFFKWQLFSLGMWFAIQGTLILIIVSYLLSKTKNFFKQNPLWWKWQEKFTGIILIALSFKLAFSYRK